MADQEKSPQGPPAPPQTPPPASSGGGDNNERNININIEDEMQQLVSGLRHERHRGPRPSRRPRRPEARTPPYPLWHVRNGPRAQPPHRQMRRTSSAKSSANIIRTATLRSTTPWSAWPRISPRAIRSSTARAISAPSMATRPPPYRFTEARLFPHRYALLEDIDKDTVDFRANFDDAPRSPKSCPPAFPIS